MSKEIWYILDENNKPVVSKSILEAGKWMEDNPHRKVVKQDRFEDENGEEIFVSTVFLALDHSFPWNEDKEPILWETMIFGGIHDQYQERYTSYEDALEGHQKAINFIKTGYNGNT